MAKAKEEPKPASVTTEDVPPVAPPPRPVKKSQTARVTVPGTHVGTHDVTFPANAENPTHAAIEALKAKLGIVSFGAGPVVEILD